MPQIVFILTGVREGQTVRLNKKFPFVNGRMPFEGSIEECTAVSAILCRYYEAVVESSEEHIRWLKKKKKKGASGGKKVPEPDDPVPSPVPSSDAAAVPASGPQDAGAGSGAGAGSPPAEPDPAPTGDGRGAEAPEVSVRKALEGLDPEDDAHWTSVGKASVKVVSAKRGKDTSRQEIEAAYPGYTRDKAKELTSALE